MSRGRARTRSSRQLQVTSLLRPVRGRAGCEAVKKEFFPIPACCTAPTGKPDHAVDFPQVVRGDLPGFPHGCCGYSVPGTLSSEGPLSVEELGCCGVGKLLRCRGALTARRLGYLAAVQHKLGVTSRAVTAAQRCHVPPNSGPTGPKSIPSTAPGVALCNMARVGPLLVPLSAPRGCSPLRPSLGTPPGTATGRMLQDADCVSRSDVLCQHRRFRDEASKQTARARARQSRLVVSNRSR